jgi:hypothetical protein
MERNIQPLSRATSANKLGRLSGKIQKFNRTTVNLNYPYLRGLLNEARLIIGEVEQPMTLQNGNFFG